LEISLPSALSVHLVDANTPVLTGIALARIRLYGRLTVLARVAVGAHTLTCAIGVEHTAAVLALNITARVIGLTELARVALRTLTRTLPVRVINTLTAVLTRIRLTRVGVRSLGGCGGRHVDLRLAVLTGVAGLA
jgi:hypothetical protein